MLLQLNHVQFNKYHATGFRTDLKTCLKWQPNFKGGNCDRFIEFAWKPLFIDEQSEHYLDGIVKISMPFRSIGKN